MTMRVKSHDQPRGSRALAVEGLPPAQEAPERLSPAESRAREDELALQLLKAEQDDRFAWEQFKAEAFTPLDGASDVRASGEREQPSVPQLAEEFWDKLAATRMESLGRQHPAAEGYIVKTWWAMRENGLAQAGEYAKAQDRARRGDLFAAELQSAAPALADPDTPEQTRRALRAELARKTRGIFAGDAPPRLAELERFTARQDELAREARGQRHQERVFAELSALPEAEAQARLASPQGRRALALSGSQASALSGMLRVKHGFDAEQREERKNAYAGQLAEKLGDLFRADAAPAGTGQTGGVGQAEQTGGAASQGREAPPVAAYKLLLGADIAPEIKDVAVARIMDGSFGKKDDPAAKAALMSGLAAGTLKPHAVDEAALLGSLTPQTADGMREFAKSLAGEDGIYIAQGFAALQRRMPPDAPPRQLAKAQEFLQHQLARAAKAGRLAEALNPDNVDNAVDRAVRLSGTEFHSLGGHLAEVPGAAAHGFIRSLNSALNLGYDAVDGLRGLKVNEEEYKRYGKDRLAALQEHLRSGGSPESAPAAPSDERGDTAGAPLPVLRSDPDGPKVGRPQLPNTDAPKTNTGKAVAAVIELATDVAVGEGVLNAGKLVKTGAKVGKKAGAAALEGVGVKPKPDIRAEKGLAAVPITASPPIELARVHNQRSKGSIVVEEGARPKTNEILGAEGFSSYGYNVKHLQTNSNKGISGKRTADYEIEGLGYVDECTPKVMTSKSISRRIEEKEGQSSVVLVQGDASQEVMAQVAQRVWGKPNVKHINTILFKGSDGKIYQYNRHK